MELNTIKIQPSLTIDLTIKDEQDAKSGNTELIVHVVPSAVPLINPTSEVTKTSPPSGKEQLHFIETERISSSSPPLTPLLSPATFSDYVLTVHSSLQRGGISKPTAARVFYCFILVITQIITNC
jgi:hypothetical protein